jgi:putative ABC transport system permease protein
VRSIWQDFKHGIRWLARAPGFTLAAVAMLGLGIGAATAVFGIVNSVLLEPLPFPDSDRVIRLAEVDVQGQRTRASLASYQDWAAYARSFDAMTAIRHDSTTVVARRTSQRVSAARVQGDPQRAVARQVAHGRLMTREEVASGASVAIVTRSLAERLWGDPRRGLANPSRS